MTDKLKPRYFMEFIDFVADIIVPLAVILIILMIVVLWR